MVRKINHPAPDRRSINFYSFLFTCMVLLLTMEVSSDGSGPLGTVTFITRMGENLDRELSDMMEIVQPNYTNITLNVTYLSDASFNARGMGGLYNLTKAFVDRILEDILPDRLTDLVEFRQNWFVVVNGGKGWWDLVLQYSLVLTICIITVLLGVLMPLCGVFFCCCRCCGRCGSRSKLNDKKNDCCMKFFLSTFLIVCGTLLLFGVVCAFVSNQHIEEGVQKLPHNLRNSVRDIDTFWNATTYQLSILLKKNFREFEASIGHTLDNCSLIVFKGLENMSNATSMDRISEIAEEFPKIRQDYQMLRDSTNELRVHASHLNDAVRRVKKDLLDILRGCVDKLEQCRRLNDNISHLQTNIDFNKLPDINAQIHDLDEILSRSDINDIIRGREKLENVQRQIQNAVKNNTDKARRKIAQAGDNIENGTNQIIDEINRFRRIISMELDTTPRGDAFIDIAQYIINEYDAYRHYTGIAISCILLLITLFIALGLICGICGKRPHSYGDDCCSKGSGSQFLICGVMFMFFFTIFIAAAVLVYFVLGVFAQKGLCVPLRAPAGHKILRTLNEINVTNLDIGEFMHKCHQNKTVYEVFTLKSRFNLDEVDNYLNEFDIDKTLNDLSETNVNFYGFSLLNRTQIDTLRRIARSGFAEIDFDKFKDELNANFTSTDFKDISRELNNVIRKVHELAASDRNAVKIEKQLQLVADDLKFCEDKLVTPMQETANRVIDTATSLELKLHLGHNSFEEGMEDLIAKVERAQDILKKQGPALIKEIATKFGNRMIGQVRKYLDRVVIKTKRELGKCGPLSLVINATLTSTCDKIIAPVNGFWFGLFCSMLTFIPTIVISVKLATLYQKQNPYSSQATETEYLYSDSDNVPLNGSRPGKDKKGKKNKRYNERASTASGGTDFAEVSLNQDTRYSDAAPKNWEDFPTGGPPHYQRAPTEYERPPPYYFPGTGEQR